MPVKAFSVFIIILPEWCASPLKTSAFFTYRVLLCDKTESCAVTHRFKEQVIESGLNIEFLLFFLATDSAFH